MRVITLLLHNWLTDWLSGWLIDTGAVSPDALLHHPHLTTFVSNNHLMRLNLSIHSFFVFFPMSETVCFLRISLRIVEVWQFLALTLTVTVLVLVFVFDFDSLYFSSHLFNMVVAADEVSFVACWVSLTATHWNWWITSVINSTRTTTTTATTRTNNFIHLTIDILIRSCSLGTIRHEEGFGVCDTIGWRKQKSVCGTKPKPCQNNQTKTYTIIPYVGRIEYTFEAWNALNVITRTMTSSHRSHPITFHLGRLILKRLDT